MDEKRKNQMLFFETRPTGEPVNSYVFRIAPQREPEYADVQRLIKESAERISLKKPED